MCSCFGVGFFEAKGCN